MSSTLLHTLTQIKMKWNVLLNGCGTTIMFLYICSNTKVLGVIL